MIPAVNRAVGAGLLQIRIDDRLAVEDHRDVLAASNDFFAVPFARWLEKARLGRDDAIHGAVTLILLDVLVAVGRVVDDLHPHALLRRIDAPTLFLVRYTNPDAVIRAGRQLELELEMKITIFLHSRQIAIPLPLADDRAVLHQISFFSTLPTIERLAVEQRRESRLVRPGGEDKKN